MRLTVGLALLLVSLPALAAEEQSPAGVVGAFYAAYEPMEPYGLPREEDLAKLDPYLSSRLRDLLRLARREQETFSKQHPDEKPPFVDGDLFSSMFEGFRSYHVADAQRMPDGTFRVRVDLAYWEESDPKVVTKWCDWAIVVREEGELRIEDFEFGGKWDFAQKGRLSDILNAKP